MRILLLNQTWFADELTALGHQVVSVGWRGEHFDVKLNSPLQSAMQLFEEFRSRGFVAERIVYYDDSGPMTFSGVEDLPVPTVFYSVDAHHHIAWHEYFARCFDLTLVAQKGYLERFSRSVAGAQWFPLWSSVFAEPDEEKTIPVCFRGTLDEQLHPERAHFFKRFKNFLPIDSAEGSFVEPFTKSEIVVNQAVKDDLNFRVFESMMCGPLLITPHLPQSGMEMLFREGEHYVSYLQG
ncbi:MAG: glycosyltransferase, partial [bacterium]|nr:glycosyltransferase [bacterium]